MVWSGKTRYENLDAALHDLEMGLGQNFVERALGVQPCTKSKHSVSRSTSKQYQTKRLPSDNRPSFSRHPITFSGATKNR